MSQSRIKPPARLERLPPYLFGRINALKQSKRRNGIVQKEPKTK